MNNTSIYEAEKRSWLWLKWKEEYAEGMMETFDLVIVGKYYGRGEGRVHLEVSFAQPLTQKSSVLKPLQK